VNVTQHIPTFIEGDAATAEVHTLAGLLALPWIERWLFQPDFYRPALIRRNGLGPDLLIAEFEGGAHWYVIAYLYGEDVARLTVGLPEWEEPKK
jgi:hypothetical protein